MSGFHLQNLAESYKFMAKNHFPHWLECGLEEMFLGTFESALEVKIIFYLLRKFQSNIDIIWFSYTLGFD